MRWDEPNIIDDNGLVRVPRVLITDTTASAAATVQFTNLGTMNFLFYEVEIKDLVPDTDDTAVRFRFSTDNGATFVATNYDRTVAAVHGTTKALVTATAQSSFNFNLNTAGENLGTVDGERYYASVFVFPLGSGVFPGVQFYSNYLNSSNVRTWAIGGGINDGITTAPNAIEFAMSTGNIASGNFKLFGWGWRRK